MSGTLNILGLHNLVSNYLLAQKRETEAFDKKEIATIEYMKAKDSTAALRKEMGEHTKAAGHEELIIVDDVACLIPMPDKNYPNDLPVYPRFYAPRSYKSASSA